MPYKDPQKHAAKQREYRRKRREAQSPSVPAGPEPGQLLGDVVADWAEAKLKVPTGPLQGQPFRVAAWQRRVLVKALVPGIWEAGLSVARKNGKSGLIATLLLAYLVGPLNSRLWRGIVVSLTGHLAGEKSGISGCRCPVPSRPGHWEDAHRRSWQGMDHRRFTHFPGKALFGIPTNQDCCDLMPAYEATIDLSGLDELRAQLADFDQVFVKWLQVAAVQIVLPALKADVPVRTGRLRDSREFYPTARGGAFGWGPQGFYWQFQGDLPERQRQIVQQLIPSISRFARDKTLQELGV